MEWNGMEWCACLADGRREMMRESQAACCCSLCPCRVCGVGRYDGSLCAVRGRTVRLPSFLRLLGLGCALPSVPCFRARLQRDEFESFVAVQRGGAGRDFLRERANGKGFPAGSVVGCCFLVLFVLVFAHSSVGVGE